MKALKVFIKPFKAPKKKWENKFSNNGHNMRRITSMQSYQFWNPQTQIFQKIQKPLNQN